MSIPVLLTRLNRNTITEPPRRQIEEGLEYVRAELVSQRVRLATTIGLPLSALNSLEAWMDFHDPMTVMIQLASTLIAACIAALFLTPWGRSHRLLVFTAGFLVIAGGFESVVCHKQLFGTAYSDSFATLFSFYSILIPTTTLVAALVGLAVSAVTTVPEAVMTSEFSRIGNAFFDNATAFSILVAGRYIANKSWEREFAASRLQADFVSAVSHDFRTPLTTLSLFIEQLSEGRFVGRPDLVSEYYRLMSSEIRRLARMVKGLLEFARIESGVAEYTFEIIDLAELVDTVAREFERSMPHNVYRILVRVSQDTPLVRGDVAALSCAVRNLLDNALKYSHGPTILVHVGLEKRPRATWDWLPLRSFHRLVTRKAVSTVEQWATIRVRDHGPGIPESERPYIFNKFVRGTAARQRVVSGSGVGLSMVSSIVAVHDGNLKLSSRIGKGSTFTILLPGIST